jgi:hypothetical protein
MTFKEAAQRTIDSIFSRLGEDVVFTVAGGQPLTVRAVRRQPDEIMDVASSRLHVETTIFQLRVVEVAAPKAGDTLQLGNESFIIQGEPQREQHGLVWKLEAYLDAS